MWCAQSSLLSIISFSNIHMQGQKESSQCTPAELRDMQVDKVMTTFSGTCMTYNAISKCHLHPWTSKVVRNSGLWWTWLLRDDKGYLCWSMCQKLMSLGSFLDDTEKKKSCLSCQVTWQNCLSLRNFCKSSWRKNSMSPLSSLRFVFAFQMVHFNYIMHLKHNSQHWVFQNFECIVL